MATGIKEAPARRNIELKARLPSLAAARAVAERVADRRLDDQHQIDTYFHCPTGRLKLREIVGDRAELISYDRPDDADTRRSSYYLVPVPDADLLKTALRERLGISKVVEKHRSIYLHDNVRIHLDTVVGLGDFLEFEAVLESDDNEESGHAIVRRLRREFEIADDDLVTGSYGEM